MLFNKSLSIHKIKAESEKAAKLIFPDFVALPAPETSTLGQVPSSSSSPGAYSGSFQAIMNCEVGKGRRREENADNPGVSVLAFLRIWLSLPVPFHQLSVLLEKAEITSGSARDNLAKTLTRFRLIVIHQLQKNRSRLQIWEPTEKAYLAIGLAKPVFQSKGGYLHQFIAFQIARWGRDHGYIAKIEFFLATNKAVDVFLSKDNELIFIEIVVSPPLEKELENILKDNSSELKPTQIWLIAKDSKTAKALSQLVSNDPRLTEIRDNIQCKLAGDFLVTHKPDTERRQ